MGEAGDARPAQGADPERPREAWLVDEVAEREAEHDAGKAEQPADDGHRITSQSAADEKRPRADATSGGHVQRRRNGR